MPILQNYVTAAGFIYCQLNRKASQIVTLPCEECPYFYGYLQGEGRECKIGEDKRILVVTDPFEKEEAMNEIKSVGDKKPS